MDPPSGADDRAAALLERLRAQAERLRAEHAPPPPPVAPPPAAPVVRSPDPLLGELGGELAPLAIARPGGQGIVRRRIAGQSSLAQVASRLVGMLVPLRLRPDGALAGWYRLGTEAGPLPFDRKVADVPADSVVHMHFIPNEPVWVTVEVADPRPVRLRLTVGRAVPMTSMVDGLATLLDLPPGDWTVRLGGQVLDGATILADHPVGPDALLTLERAGRARKAE